MYILNLNAHPDVLCWLPHGRGFIINDKKRLEKEILPKYFKVSKFTSFTRRLNRWEFTIHTQGHKKSSYFHPKFVRHEHTLCLEMMPAPQTKKTRSIGAMKQHSQLKKATVVEDQSIIEKSGISMADNMPSLPSNEKKGIVDHTQQLLYNLPSNPLQHYPVTDAQLYYHQLAFDPSMAMAAVGNSYFLRDTGLNALPYATMSQQHLNILDYVKRGNV
jgi:hypothetical protein